jgi:hypothetical protein
MKFNLKNRPKHEGFGLLGEYEKWFEGFEKELRKWYDSEPLIFKDRKTREIYKWQKIIIKEILGE